MILVLSILRWGKRSWRPWILSLVIELLSQLAVLKGYESEANHSNMMSLEKQKYSRRLKLIMLNLMRGAFYLRITRPRLERFCNGAESKPIISMAAGNLIKSNRLHHNILTLLSAVLRDYLPLWEKIYFYTSAS